ncbi:hypothetical protein INS49_014161 [Diaporthe citri]|uniref:uncharacterized protein n=1 Tax=Diaporthe citri TaxID=83186 RepID=UPI001C7EBDEC|nr:uncharacterized protein INS49_014161 [Diaporthe citri]KAG6358277.1 hypothetical protein INS49_014161 [Diaporthe citri]
MSNISTRVTSPVNGTEPHAEPNKTPNTIRSPTSTPIPPSLIAKEIERPHPPKPNHSSPGISKPRRTRQPPRPGLRLFTRDVKFALPLAPSRRERMAPGPPADEATTSALARCVDLALRLLEEGRGNRVLVGVGMQIVAERRFEAARAGGGRPAAGIYKGELRDMGMWVAMFLRQVREFGIPICVCDSLSGYGLTQRWTWGSNMEDYDCRNSAVVYIHQCLVDGLLRSARSVEQCTKEQEALNAEIQNGNREMDSSTMAAIQRLQDAQANAQMSLERAVFCISVFLAHEFVHCFTGYLTGSAQPGTPPGLDASPYSDPEHGEAGWYWTQYTFGGLGHAWFDKDEPEEPSHFGVPMLLDYNKRRSNSFFYQINHAVVKQVLGDNWASLNSIDPDWFLKLKDENTKTSFKEWDTAYEEIVARTTVLVLGLKAQLAKYSAILFH